MSLFYKEFIDPLQRLHNSETAAFCISGTKYSYQQVWGIVDSIIPIIKYLDEDVVGLYATDSIYTYSSILALWMVGKAYVPLNPNQPVDRHKEVLLSVDCKHVLTSDDSYDADIEGIEYFVTKGLDINSKGETSLELLGDDDNRLAYILFTSGSTGKPKGVQITRGDLAAFIDSMNHIGLDITPEDKCLQPFDLTFDFSVSSYVIPLAKGASVYTVPIKATKFTYIAELLEKHHLTMLQMVPSMIRNLLPYIEEVDVSSVRYNILCGEALTGKVIVPWHQANPEMVSYNMYGPTEDTVFCTYYLINKNNVDNLLAANDIVSIGKSFKNSGVLLVDDNNQEIVKPNIEGELCLCGEQLTPGYWKNDKENVEKFFVKNDIRYYRSGDMCYYADDKNLMYVSRKDFQVKINGFRVELGEIENKFASLTGGKYSVVMPFINKQGNTELAIIIEGKEYDYQEHKTALANALPSYEVPSKWIFTRSIPLNQNGKVDRKEIKRMFNL